MVNKCFSLHLRLHATQVASLMKFVWYKAHLSCNVGRILQEKEEHFVNSDQIREVRAASSNLYETEPQQKGLYESSKRVTEILMHSQVFPYARKCNTQWSLLLIHVRNVSFNM